MLSTNKIKLIKSLALKKHRISEGLFIAEGDKLVLEMLDSAFSVVYIAATKEWFDDEKKQVLAKSTEIDIVNQKELDRLSFQKSPQNVLCIVQLPNYQLNIMDLKHQLTLILDSVQDPGNLGTILRVADWFGIEQIICSKDTTDAFNPKVVQSTMGAICRVKTYYEELNTLLPKIKLLGLPLYGTTLDGDNIYNTSLSNEGLIMLGNESKGINTEWINMLDTKLRIPFYPEETKRSESLNVAVASAIVCAEFRRRSNLRQ
jgi:TrmH family RNA methyltransferase